MKTRALRIIYVAASLFVCVEPSAAGAVICPQPLHIVRRVEQPFVAAQTIDEYCEGSRLVAVAGARTTILDYAQQQGIEIEPGGYSVVSFGELAASNEAAFRASGVSAEPAWKIVAAATSDGAGRERFELTSSGERARGFVTVDRSLRLPRAAVEVLIGASFPSRRRPIHDTILSACSPRRGGHAVSAQQADDAYALPVVEEMVTDVAGTKIVIRNEIVKMDAASVPPDKVRIDPAARRHPPRLTPPAAVQRELDTLPGVPR